jgi:hypothetical protein
MSELLGKVSDDHGKERKTKCCGNQKQKIRRKKKRKEEYAATSMTNKIWDSNNF